MGLHLKRLVSVAVALLATRPLRFFATALAAGTLASWLAIAGTGIQAHASGHPVQYGNPFRSVSNLQGMQIDQGVDYYGDGYVYPIGEGVVDMTSNSGWPNGIFIAYHLTAGPASGREVYVAECIWPDPPLYLGEHIYGDTLLGTMQSCNPPGWNCPNANCGIETGWGDPNHLGSPLAAGGYGAQASAYGVNFNSFLVALGAKPGIQYTSTYDTLPDGWPRWSSGSQCQYTPGTNIQFSVLSSKTVTGAYGGRYLGYEQLTFSLERIVNTANWTWCFQTHVVMRWSATNAPAYGSFETNVRVSCDGSIEGEGWAIDHSFNNSVVYANSDWRTASGPCNIYWGADDADGSYGTQVLDQYGNVYDYYHGTTYVTYGTL